jgi:hypothetical protein
MTSTGDTSAQQQQLRDFLNRLADQTVGAAYEVSNQLGAGFLEKVYEAALHRELESRGLVARRQAPMPVRYKGRLIGEYGPTSWWAADLSWNSNVSINSRRSTSPSASTISGLPGRHWRC